MYNKIWFLSQLTTPNLVKTAWNIANLRWHRTVHVWLPHKNFNAYFSKSTINSLFKGVCIYKVLVYLSSPANQIAQLCVKWKLEIPGVWMNTKCIHNSIMLNFGLTTIYLPIYKWVVLVQFFFCFKSAMLPVCHRAFQTIKIVTYKQKQLTKIGLLSFVP